MEERKLDFMNTTITFQDREIMEATKFSAWGKQMCMIKATF